MVPDADLLRGGEYHIGADGFFARESEEAYLTQQTYMLELGIIEYVNIQAGYSSGFTFGLKARILGETSKFLPSLALGVHNLFTHKETNYFAYDGADEPENEIYLALSKSIETIKTRLHLGVQSIPEIESEQANPFFAIEKYFGYGLYASFEGYRRFEQYPLSLFVTWRTLGKKLEIYGGAVDIQSLFFDADNNFSVSLRAEENNTFVRPGIRLGIRLHGLAGFGSRDGFVSLEDRLVRQQTLLDSLYQRVDSLEKAAQAAGSTIERVDSSLDSLIQSGYGDDGLKNLLLEKIVSLRAIYSAEPFEPDQVGEVMNEIVGFREKAVPVLREFVVDAKRDRYVRMYSVTALGEIGNRAASDILLDLIGQTDDPDLKVEILIALGKMKETRAMYLMEQLANDPNEAVALTAQDVLSRLSQETGAFIGGGAAFGREAEQNNPQSMRARKMVKDPDANRLKDRAEQPDTVNTGGEARSEAGDSLTQSKKAGAEKDSEKTSPAASELEETGQKESPLNDDFNSAFQPSAEDSSTDRDKF